MTARPPRILVMRPRALGDVLLTTPALRALRHGLPDASLEVLVDAPLAPILEVNPHVDRVWRLPRGAGPRAVLRCYRALLGRQFDIVIDLHGSPRTAMLARATRAPRRIGYALRGRGRFYTERVARDHDRHGRFRMLYAARTNLEIVARLGLPVHLLADSHLELPVPAEVRQRLRADLEQRLPRGPRVGLAAAGTWAAKTWSPQGFAALGDRLRAAGMQVILLWGPGEEGVVERVQRHMRQPAVRAPRTDLLELAALLAELDLLIANDSGVKHVAASQGTPTLTLYGPTNPRAWEPESGPHEIALAAVPCLACNLRACTHHACMRLLKPEPVAQHALRMLARREPAEAAP